MAPITVTPEWLNSHLDEVVVVDGSWYMPHMKRNPKEEFLASHIKTAVPLFLKPLGSPTAPLPHTGIRFFVYCLVCHLPKGKLSTFDQNTNLVLSECQEVILSKHEGPQYVECETMVVKGDDVAIVGDLMINASNDDLFKDVRCAMPAPVVFGK
ncbi:hypothetical protein KIPB_002984 [Kipferlia bialata]|uniref:Sm domain-containing protein n=1 Tax=Kipferlia bialata TaxID=797122 RepID=A0A9K3GG38_9EUKA|nr:hypothetical protein KIPB_001676 [Kipferlia bialata]GIQ81939.1 hypothetical protein KIPB_002984 [Kipferlia bialata]|eukprot:g1676.t1